MSKDTEWQTTENNDTGSLRTDHEKLAIGDRIQIEGESNERFVTYVMGSDARGWHAVFANQGAVPQGHLRWRVVERSESRSKNGGITSTTNSPLLKIILLGLSDDVFALIRDFASRSSLVADLIEAKDPNGAENLLRTFKGNTLFINPNAFDWRLSKELLLLCTETFPVCLVGSASDFTGLKGIPKDWQERLRHYHRLQIDTPLPEFRDQLEYVLRGCQRYLLKQVVWTNLAQIAEQSNVPAVADKAREALQAAKAQTDLENRLGIDKPQMEALLNRTLAEAQRTARRAEIGNLATLVVGLTVIVVTAAGALLSQSPDYWALGTGGMGAAAAIAALVTSPARRLGSGTARLAFIQTAYFGFLQQVRLLNSPGDESLLQRSERLQAVTESLLQRLEPISKEAN